MPNGWVMAAMPLYSELPPSCLLVGMVKGPRVMLSCWQGLRTKVEESFTRFSGRNWFSKMSLKCIGSTVGKRVWRKVAAGGRGGGLPMVSAGLGAGGFGVGCWLSRCLIIRFRRTSITCSAGRDAVRVKASVLSASAPVAGEGGVLPQCRGIHAGGCAVCGGNTHGGRR